MITNITGLPGNGKTLYALNWVKAKAEKENRPVYYNGIPDLKLPWLQLDNAEDWHKLPAGAIVVIDECQRVFRPRPSGSAVPLHVSELETHRHKGIDLVLITQHPQLLDTNVRRLVGQHFHVVRKFGMARASIFEWGQIKEPTKAAIKEAVRHEFAYPRESFGWYKSAELHTHKRKMPMRFWFVLIAPLLIGLLLWQGYRSMNNVIQAPTNQTAPKGGAGSSSQPPAGGGVIKTAAQYVEAHQPRVQGLAYTAPIYDEVTKPVRAPFPAACVNWHGKGCRCYSQQGTRLDMTVSMCEQIAANGFFVPWDEKRTEEPRKNVSERETPSYEPLPPSGGLIVAPVAATLSESPKKP